MTTKLERRKEALQRHYDFLERFSEFLGNKQDGKKLSLKLLKLEREAHKAATDYCNGAITDEKWDVMGDEFLRIIVDIFGKIPPGFFVNGDARGYALKIDDEKVRDYYPQSIQFHRDIGGYGILSPEIEG